jgi:putative transposase
MVATNKMITESPTVNDEPGRKRLPHELPLWVDPQKEVFFLTICCAKRQENQLCHPHVAREVFDSIRFRNEQGLWFVRLCLLMPDHLHMLMSFPPGQREMKAVVFKWKEWVAKQAGVRWQRDYFEHRLRSEESYREKADYVLENPVRAGLAGRADAWPYVWFADGPR